MSLPRPRSLFAPLLALLLVACGGTSSSAIACTEDAECMGGQLCTRGLCREACSPSDACSDSQLSCHPRDGVCVECVTTEDCAGSERCENDACLDGCTDDGECGGGERCDVATRTCMSLGCGGDVDCAGGERCRVATGVCAPICGLDGDCADGEICAVGLCLDAAASCSTGEPNSCPGLAECVDRVCSCPPARACGAACVDRQSDPRHCGACGNECRASDVCRSGCCAPGDRVDLLFVIDGSASMEDEQALLAEQLVHLIRELATGDKDLDGTRDFAPVTDVHAGVVTVDMGSGGFLVEGCSDSSRGDDGLLRSVGDSTISGCVDSYPSFLDFLSFGADPEAFASELSCVARVGIAGCGFEQQLEAPLKALTPASSSLRFAGNTTGHGTGPNELFLRDDSVLAVILVTDEDDCSSADPELYNPRSTRYPGPVNLRCFQHAGALHPVSRYAEGFLALRRDPRRFVFGALVGVPPDLLSDTSDLDHESVLADPRMQERIDPEVPDRLAASCSVPGRGAAFPPRRVVGLARDLDQAGSGTAIVSICGDDYGSVFDGIFPRLADPAGEPVCP